ncbi:unnamed protein product [Phaeothamnion confervicola]
MRAIVQHRRCQRAAAVAAAAAVASATATPPLGALAAAAAEADGLATKRGAPGAEPKGGAPPVAAGLGVGAESMGTEFALARTKAIERRKPLSGTLHRDGTGATPPAKAAAGVAMNVSPSAGAAIDATLLLQAAPPLSPSPPRTLEPPLDTLFFGCRYRERDFLYASEWAALEAGDNAAAAAVAPSSLGGFDGDGGGQDGSKTADSSGLRGFAACGNGNFATNNGSSGGGTSGFTASSGGAAGDTSNGGGGIDASSGSGGGGLDASSDCRLANSSGGGASSSDCASSGDGGRSRRRNFRLHAAFSRDRPHKVYVQHRIDDAGAEVADLLLRRGAAVFVSGAARRMPSDVREAFKRALAGHGGLSEREAERHLARMERCGRYRVEAWS